jgi:Uma2 family endonuclease
MPLHTPLYTVADVRALPDDGNRYEVIAGQLFVTPAPGTRHQRILANLFLLVGTYVKRHKLGEAWFAPLDVVFGAHTLVEPDLLFVRGARLHIVTERELTGPPDLAVEVVSPSSVRADRGRKRQLYLDEGVAEYWVVDPERGSVEVQRAAGTVSVYTDAFTWQPDEAVEPLLLDVRDLLGARGV